MRVLVKKEKCTGCHQCEIVCSLYHTGNMNPNASAIKIIKDDLGKGVYTPYVCLQCNENKMFCLDGMDVDRKSMKEKFIWPCETIIKCPHRAIFSFNGKVFHCDLCGGDPQCVKICTTSALYIRK